MSLIEWRSEYETGIADVDHEHRELVGLINELYEVFGAAGGPAHSVEILGELYARISAHFALEERHMREAAYDEYEPHKAEHERLLDDLLDLMDDHESGSIHDVDAFGARLRDWFSNHFRTHDARLHRRLG